MAEGKILAASKHGAYVIRMTGDVRLTLSTTIDDYFDKMYEDDIFVSVWVDLCDADGIDSTTLGILAKLAIEVKQKFGLTPAIYSCDSGINRLLKSMGFQRLFNLHEELCGISEFISEIPVIPTTEQGVKEKVIEAHRVLMDISEDNKLRFKDLMAVLEAG